jgi:hypothetical protein
MCCLAFIHGIFTFVCVLLAVYVLLSTSCATFNFICATFNFICATLSFICGTFNFMCYFRDTLSFICGTFNFICATFNFMCGEFIFICVVILTCIPNIVCSFKHVSARNIDMINLCYVGIKFVSLQPTRYVRLNVF